MTTYANMQSYGLGASVSQYSMSLANAQTSFQPSGFGMSYNAAPQVSTMVAQPVMQSAAIVQAPQVTYVQQAPQVTMVEVAAPEYEIRPLSEDRIVRAAARYKDGSPAGLTIQQTQTTQPAIVADQVAAVTIVDDAGVAPPMQQFVAAVESEPQGVVPALQDVDLMQALDQTIGPLTRVCMLGGTAFKDEASEPLVQALAAEFSARLRDSVVVLTGGMAGVQETFAKGCVQGPAVVNMLPQGQASNYGVGTDFPAFIDLDERITVFGQVGDIYISVEGGPGVSKEANAAFSRGAIVLPMISTGGASGGMFDYPAGALEVPQFASPEQWQLLAAKGEPQATAATVVDIIERLLPPPA